MHLTSNMMAVLLIATNSHSLLWCGSLSKVVKINVKPAVDFFVDGFVLGAELLRCHTILESLPTCSGIHQIIISNMSGHKLSMTCYHILCILMNGKPWFQSLSHTHLYHKCTMCCSSWVGKTCSKKENELMASHEVFGTLSKAQEFANCWY